VTRSVLFIAPSAYPLGGVQTWLDTMLSGLANRNWRPVLGLVSGQFHDAPAYLREHPWNDCVLIENPTGSRTGRIQSIARILGKLKPDLVVGVNIADLYDAFEQMPESLQNSMKLVMTMHGLESELCNEAARVAGICDAIICTNRLTEQVLISIVGIQPSKVKYAPYGVATPSNASEQQASNQVMELLFAARLEQSQKRVFDLPGIVHGLETANLPYRLTIAGEGPDRSELENRFRPQVERGQVRFAGHVPRNILLQDFLPGSNAFLVTSEWETGPISIWEAMAHRIPVVTSAYIGSGLERALVNDENCLMFPIGDTATAVKKIISLAQDKTVGDRLTVAAAALVKSRYSETASQNAWNDRLSEVIDSASSIQRSLMRTSKSAEGHLNRMFGDWTANRLRQVFGRKYSFQEPGGEWPHVSLNSRHSIGFRLSDIREVDQRCKQ